MARIERARVVSALLVAAGVAATALTGCDEQSQGPSLAKSAESDENIELPPVPADGPLLGALADVSPVLDRPGASGRQIGYLHAGAKLPRTEKPFSTDGCPGGWYPILPRGVVCAGQVATTDLSHPTLVAMALPPKPTQPLPYTYARTRKGTPLFERDPKRDNAVIEQGKVNKSAGMAVVGSWSAMDPEGKMQRLGMLTNGLFVKAADLRAAEPTEFTGVELNKDVELPVGFVVKRGVRAWKVDQGEADKLGQLDYHETLMLTGRFRTVKGHQYWAVDDGRYVRHRDVTLARRRNAFPDFVTGDTKWIDISVITGVAVMYEGKRPVFATLCSVGRDRLGDPKASASTALGTFAITGKHITAAKFNPKGLAEYFEIFDVPWAMELGSGQLLHGAYWHDRFGIEHGPGNIQLSPADARRMWLWASPEIPAGWHGVNQADGARTMVHIRK